MLWNFVAVDLHRELQLAPQGVDFVTAQTCVDLGRRQAGGCDQGAHPVLSLGFRDRGDTELVGGERAEPGGSRPPGAAGHRRRHGVAAESSLLQTRVESPCQPAVAQVRRDVEEGACCGDDRDAEAAGDVPTVELLELVDLDSWPAATRIPADQGHLDVAARTRRHVPQGVGPVMTEIRALPHRQDRRLFGGVLGKSFGDRVDPAVYREQGASLQRLVDRGTGESQTFQLRAGDDPVLTHRDPPDRTIRPADRVG